MKGFVVSETYNEIINPNYSLHDYQRQVLKDIIGALSTPECRTIAHLPTGAGKTRIASHVACHLLNKADTTTSLIVWLASTEELCEQAAEELAKAWTNLGTRDAYVYRYWGSYNLDLCNLYSGFLVTGLAKLRSASSTDNTLLAHLADRTSAVIFDEAHQAVAETYSFVTEQLCSQRPPLLGLTATPGRTSNLTESDYRLAAMFNGCRVSIDPRGHDSPVTYLIQNRFLAIPRFTPINFDTDDIAIAPQPGLDYSQDDLDHIGCNHKRTLKILEIVREATQHHQRIVVFCPSVSSAFECNRLLVQAKSKDVISEVITADTPLDRRHTIIRSFKSDSPDHMVIFNYGVLTAGFDAPRTSCVVIARPTTSLVLYSQMAGRAMRGPRAGGNQRAEILTVADTNLPGFGSVTEAFTNWETLWSII